MRTSTVQRNWKRDHNRLLATNKKWQAAQRKVCRAVETLGKYLKQNTQEVNSLVKKTKAQKSLLARKNHSSSVHKALKKTHAKQNHYQALQARSHKNLMKLSRTIESTIRGLH